RYDAPSKGAVLFERLYEALLDQVFGRDTFGPRLWRASADACFTNEYFHLFDRVLLHGDERLWFGTEGRAGLVRRVAEAPLAADPASVPAWGEVHTITMTNVF